jgi:hypothetical protein
MFPEFQNTFTWGAVFQIAITIVSLAGFFWAMKTDISVIKNNIYHLQETQKTMTEAFSQLGKILTQVAVQDSRINMIEKRLDELAHGKGHIV